MPLWLFLLLLIVLILLVAAAIIVPVVLVVIPKQNHSSGKTLASCQHDLMCANGGTNIIASDGSCKCLCVGGFTGTTCTQHSDAGCTTTSLGGTPDATVGNAIPRLLSSAQTNYSIPLNARTVLALFSEAESSCSDENSLVTFNSAAQKKREVNERDGNDVELVPTKVQKRESATSSSAGVETSNGIVFASSSPSQPSSPGATPAPASSSDGSAVDANNSTAIDFARTVVLYVFQQTTQMNSAVNAQQVLQDFFSGRTNSTGQKIDPNDVILGSGFTCDLNSFTLNGNGTTVGRSGP